MLFDLLSIRARGARRAVKRAGEILMTGADAIDDTSDDHERKEAELLAQDRDAARVSTADVHRLTARELVANLVEEDVVRPVPEHRILVHEPSGEPFDSIHQLGIFHRGWKAARDALEGGES